MQRMAQTSTEVDPEHSGLTTIKTPFYDLIEAISEEVNLGENKIVAETVLDLLDRGKIRFVDSNGEMVLSTDERFQGVSNKRRDYENCNFIDGPGHGFRS